MDLTNNITLDRLRYFSKAAELEHVGQAAKLLHMTPSVVSSAIRVLEEELGRQLFIRAKQKVRLTEDGRKLLVLAQEILAATSGLRHRLGEKAASISGHYRIGGSHFLMNSVLAPGTATLAGLSSALTFELSSSDTGVALAKLQAGLLDCALVFRSSYTDKLPEDILWSGNFQIALRRNHPLLRDRSATRHLKLSGLPALAFRTSAGGNFWEHHPALTGLGIDPKNRFFYDDTETAVKLLEATSGWAFLPELVVQSDPRLRALPMKKKLQAPVNVSLISGNSDRATQLRLALLKKLSAHTIFRKPS